MRSPYGAGAALVAAALVFAPRSAAAQSTEELVWSDDWRRIHPSAYVVAGVAIGATIMFDHLIQFSPEPILTGPSLFDGPARSALRAPAEEARDAADVTSDILLIALGSWAGVDSLLVAGLGYGSSDLAWQLTSIALEAIAADYVIRRWVKALVDRERPFAPECTAEDRASGARECSRRGRSRSFYSAHTSAAFSAAGVLCLSHAYLPLYGSDAADAFACGTAMVMASAIGILRVVADRHWMTDVVVGALIGLGTGLLLPWALHYGWDPTDDDDRDVRVAAAPLGTATPTLSFGGAF